MENLIKIENVNDVLCVDSRIIAQELGVQHKNFLETIDTYLSIIEKEFGRVTFETLPFKTAGGVQYQRVAFLTEDQSIFAGTLSRNSEQVVRFKVRLVKAFSEARKALDSLSKPMNTLDLMQLALDQMKLHDRRLTDAENRLMEVEAKVDTDPNYYTIKAFANIKKVNVNYSKAVELGKLASKICSSSGLPIDKVKDSVYGLVNSYPKTVLEQVFLSGK